VDSVLRYGAEGIKAADVAQSVLVVWAAPCCQRGGAVAWRRIAYGDSMLASAI